jgi:hypothetical protein
MAAAALQLDKNINHQHTTKNIFSNRRGTAQGPRHHTGTTRRQRNLPVIAVWRRLWVLLPCVHAMLL